MKLQEIQQQLKAPKGQHNKFGNYKYRSCEDILEAVKPLLGESTLTISDEVKVVGSRVYIVATATHTSGDVITATEGWAREADTKKGMDDAQITGSASSYARKYALNGLFCIDDTKDSDATNNHGNIPPNQTSEPVNISPITAQQLENIIALDSQLQNKEIANDLKKGALHVSSQRTDQVGQLYTTEGAKLISLLTTKLK